MARPNLVPREYLQFMLKSGGWGARLKKGQRGPFIYLAKPAKP